MTDDDKALAKLLRVGDSYEVGDARHKAADRIEALSAENERLREALSRIRQKSCFNPFRTLPEASDSLYWCFCEANLALGDTK